MTDSSAPIPAAEADIINPGDPTGGRDLYLDCTIPATETNDPTTERFYLGRVGPMTVIRLAAHLENERKARAAGDNSNAGNQFASIILKAIQQMMSPGELDRFDTWTARNDATVPQVVDWIMAMVETQGNRDDGGPDRPLEESSPSQGGQQQISGGSTDGGQTPTGAGSAL